MDSIRELPRKVLPGAVRTHWRRSLRTQLVLRSSLFSAALLAVVGTLFYAGIRDELIDGARSDVSQLARQTTRGLEATLDSVQVSGRLLSDAASGIGRDPLDLRNLLRATVRGGADDGRVRADVHGEEVLLQADKVPAGLTDVWVGVRPEKLTLGESGGRNRLHGRVVDASFTGVATQYLVRMPWGQELMAFEQNTGARGMLAPGTRVDVSWRPEFAFLLDASQDVNAGIEES